ncbi:DUF1349 domain-containing protein [Nodularia spumigena]|uniref:DUF1349 domain-containing protein n=1 Tax=Nodularia spumigena TaxID=70799 RepID=UPI002B21AAA6|nr:DUF1349 domain-containing protein [Nodularia spumigena]MEA5557689.1 DUF1349 domain-containing protein [Nodularia spumigena CH309]
MQAASAQSLSCSSDEFNDPSTLTDWTRIEFSEGWNATHLESLAINAGALTMVPHTAVWFEDYRGPMLYKTLEGDFAVTTSVTATGRDGVSVPRSQFSLAGLMIRAPREITPATWTPGDENYVFLSTGYTTGASEWSYEVKTTTNSNSILQLSSAPGPTSTLQLVRIGDAIIALLRPEGGTWSVHARFTRSDLDGPVQVGMVAYTDWTKCQTFAPFDHNANTLVPPLAIPDPSPGQAFDPDLRATYEYVRFAVPSVPPELIGADLTDAALVPDGQLLAFLGASLDLPSSPCCLADYNADGLSDVLDLLDFLADFSACDGQVVPCGQFGDPDLNRDGIVVVLDLLDFLDAFSNGC